MKRFALLVSLVGATASAASVETLIGDCRRAMDTSALPPHLRGLVYYQDFDHKGECVCNEGWAYKQAIDPTRLDPGRFGTGYRSERARTNFLSPNQASAEQGTDGFVAGKGVTLSSVAARTRFGGKVLRAQTSATGVLFTLAPVTVKARAPYRKKKAYALSMYVRTESKPAKVRLTLVDTATPAKTDKKPKTDKKAKPVKTEVRPGELTLGPR